MIDPIADGVTLVCPTFNREAALRTSVPNKLSIRGVQALLFAIDGSSDGSADYLRGIEDPRIEVVELPHGGPQVTRNRALDLVATPWVLMVDDDDLCPPDFLEKVGRAATQLDADLVGAPWLNMTGSASSPRDILDSCPLEARITFRSHPSARPPAVAITPFLNSCFLARTSVLTHVRYDPRLGGNSWREETDMFLRCAEAGYTLAKTPETYSWIEQRFSGGVDRRRLRYEYWIARNEMAFLRRHDEILRHLGGDDWRGWFTELLATVVPRLTAIATAPFRRARRLTRAVR